MKVTILCQARPHRSVAIEGNTLFHDANRQVFSMIRPRGDDWLQKVYSSFDFQAVSVVSDDREMAVTLETVEQALEFEEWLLFANAEAAEGYSTMRG